jgi:hypothetical protein
MASPQMLVSDCIQANLSERCMRRAKGRVWHDTHPSRISLTHLATGACLCTGIMGPLLGGGHGLLQGQHGLLTDQLIKARIVLANG